MSIPRATLGTWVGQCGARLESVTKALGVELLRCKVLHADETKNPAKYRADLGVSQRRNVSVASPSVRELLDAA